MLRVYNNTARYVDQGGNKVKMRFSHKLWKMCNNSVNKMVLITWLGFCVL